MNTLREICTAILTTLFALCSLTLFFALLYVLWRRQRFRQRSDNTCMSQEDPLRTPSKELIYFFCWKTNNASPHSNNNLSRVEPAQSPTSDSPEASAPPEDALAKWQEMHGGPCRALYTIKEGETEGCDNSVENGTKAKKVSLEDCFDALESSTEAVAMDVEDDMTPFSTPCASPPYYTPSPSPSRGDETVPFEGK